MLLRGRGTAVDPWAALDGRDDAPVTDPRFPTLFTGLTGTSYPVRPPWRVADVDYGVGVPDAVTPRDPGVNAADLIAEVGSGNVSFNVAGYIAITGDNLVFDRWDFTDLQVFMNGSENTTFTNCHFEIGPTYERTPVHSDAGAGGTVVFRNCYFDGTKEGAHEPIGTQYYIMRIGAAAGTTLTVEYCYFTGAWQDVITPGSGNDVTIRYNTFHNHGWDASGLSHVDIVQWQTVPAGDYNFSFNTIYQAAANGSGLPASLNAATIYSGLSGTAGATNLSNNTYVGVGTTHQTETGDNGKGLNYFVYLTADAPAAITDATVNQNYVTADNYNGLAYPTPGDGVTGTDFVGNINLQDGGTISAPF